MGQNFDETFEGFLAAGDAVSAQRHFLGEQGEEIAQARARFGAQGLAPSPIKVIAPWWVEGSSGDGEARGLW